MGEAIVPRNQGGAETIHVLMAADSRCLLGAAAAMQSIMDSALPTVRLHFHLITDGVPLEAVARLRAVPESGSRRAQLTHVDVDLARLSHLTQSKLISRASYARLLLDAALPAEVERCIYVDSDLVFRRDISELWAIPLEGRTVGAVPNLNPSDAAMHQRRLGLAEPRYLNAGVLLIDVAQWRRRAIGERAIEFAERHATKLILHDQDALNGVLQRDWLELPWPWNVWVIDEGLSATSAAVFHFMGAPKPWEADYAGRFRAHYFEALDRTPFRGTRPWNPLGFGAVLARLRRRVPYAKGAIRMLRLGFRSGR